MLDYKLVELLLVEDNPFDEELTIKALRRHGVANEIHVVRDGAEALDYMLGAEGSVGGTPSPRLILLDLNLPKVSGLEVLRRLKTDPRTKLVPVVVMTSSEEEVDLVQSYQLGVNGYVVKPMDFEKYTEAVRHLGLFWLLCNTVAPPAGGQGDSDE